MKKFFLLALLALLFSCSEGGFDESKVVATVTGNLGSVKDIITCIVEKSDGGKYCHEISASACGIMGGSEAPEGETCIVFACGWTDESVKYGEKSTLFFDLDSTEQSDCSWNISYGGKPLAETTEYTIVADYFTGLSYDKDTSIVARATVTCEDKTASKNCSALKVEPISKPQWTCGWTNEEVKYGGKSTLSFNLISTEQTGCVHEISYEGKPLDEGTEYTITEVNFPGLSYDKDTTLIAKATVTCDNLPPFTEDCNALKVDSVPGPKKNEGKLSFKKFDYEDKFFIGTAITEATHIENTIEITNKEEAKCGDIEIEIGGTPAKLGTEVKAIAVVTCEYTGKLKLDSISAEVLPDPAIGKCELAGTSKTTMRSDETLSVGISVDNNYERCKIEYAFNGTTYADTTNSLSLATYGNQDLKQIRARVTCGTDAPKTENCPEVSVASYIKVNGSCTNENREQFTLVKGKTIIEFACDNHKSDFYISCRPGPNQLADYSQVHNYTIEIEGHTVGSNSDNIRSIVGDNGYNFPELQTISEGSLLLYPKPIIISAEENLSCGIW